MYSSIFCASSEFALRSSSICALSVSACEMFSWFFLSSSRFFVIIPSGERNSVIKAGDAFSYSETASLSSAISSSAFSKSFAASLTVPSESSAECEAFAKSEYTFFLPSAKILNFSRMSWTFSFASARFFSEKPAALSFASSIPTMSSVIDVSSFWISLRFSSSSEIFLRFSSAFLLFAVICVPAVVIFSSKSEIFFSTSAIFFSFL